MQARWDRTATNELIRALAAVATGGLRSDDHGVQPVGTLPGSRPVHEDECVGHMTEKVGDSYQPNKSTSSRASSPTNTDRRVPAVCHETEARFLNSRAAGDGGHRFHTTGLTHDERGYPMMNAECQAKCVARLVEKYGGTR